MYHIKNKFILLSLTTLLAACGGGDGDGIPGQASLPDKNESDALDLRPVFPESLEAPEVISISKNDTALKVNETVIASSSCIRCDPSQTKYTWYVDLNNDGDFSANEKVQTGESLTIAEDYYGLATKVEVQAFNDRGDSSDVEYITYQYRAVVDLSVGYGGIIALFNNGDVETQSSYIDGRNGFSYDKKYVTVGTSWAWNQYALTKEGRLDFSGVWMGDYGKEGLDSGVVDVVSNRNIGIALKDDGTIVKFGVNSAYLNIPEELKSELHDIVKVSLGDYVAVALRKDGKAISWGFEYEEGKVDSPDQIGFYQLPEELNKNLVDVVANDLAFAAITADGKVVAWGVKYEEDIVTGNDISLVQTVIDSKTEPVLEVVANRRAFTAIYANEGGAISWGDVRHGGDSSSVDFSSGVKKVLTNSGMEPERSANNGGAFIALKNDGTLVTWGSVDYGHTTKDLGGNFSDIYSLQPQYESNPSNWTYGGAFGALRNDGTVIGIGDKYAIFGADETFSTGGPSNSSSLINNNIATVISTWKSFVAIDENGQSKGSWGYMAIEPTIDAAKIFPGIHDVVILFEDDTVAYGRSPDKKLAKFEPEETILEYSLEP